MAFSSAAVVVIDHSEANYRAANRLRHEEELVTAIDAYGAQGWRPDQAMPPLLSAKDLGARITVLDGLKLYTTLLVELTGAKLPAKTARDKDKVAPKAAAATVGDGLMQIDKSLSTLFPKALADAPILTQIDANAVTTAVEALSRYLTDRKLRRSLPKVTADMNKNVDALCELLARDIAVLKRETDVSYRNLENSEGQFLDQHGAGLDPVQKREEVARLLALASAKADATARLDALSAAIEKLAMTHQALAAAAQNNNPQPLREKIAELFTAGQELGDFYGALPQK